MSRTSPALAVSTSDAAPEATPAAGGGNGKKIALGIVEADAEAKAKWDLYKSGADHEALKWLTQQSAADTKSGADTNVRHMSSEVSNVNLNIGLLCGSYASVARMMDEIDGIPGLAGVLLTFDEFVSGTKIFGERIQPLMKTRQHVVQSLKAAE